MNYKKFFKENKKELNSITKKVKLKIIHVDDLSELYEKFAKLNNLNDGDLEGFDEFQEYLYSEGYKINNGLNDWYNTLSEEIAEEINE